MKSTVLVVSAITVLFAAVSGHAVPGPALPSPRGEERGAGPSHGELARMLELTETQQQQVAAILSEERAQEDLRRQKEKALRRELREVGEAASFDEQAARKLSRALADLDADRMVGHLKTRHRIDLLLTANQRAKAKRFRPEKGQLRPPCLGPEEGGAAPAAPEGW
ncbi:Spy/CpxP family protein refolding chaperone [Geomonas subterranea]|uniref:Spy/CpxP family protein refolding chaperone n=1 Tax=Geomonas subterranea TaxID=2847989 RepID=A0ABX8LLA5_9BACT|nr:Spy/CpxP family protein refolding chaperone [Geomonas subterranea]QXE92284.1 Spy/CpxP family protein refolding chaperone [Geomonas subterranea]QXM09617.1 Spy/CpxP family protein refolding chaperone [Geomonas subterranea]